MNFKPYGSWTDIAYCEAALLRHPVEVSLRVGALDQHVPESPSGHPGVEPLAPALLYIGIDFVERGISSQILDQRLTPRPQNAVYLVQCLYRFREVLEGR